LCLMGSRIGNRFRRFYLALPICMSHDVGNSKISVGVVVIFLIFISLVDDVHLEKSLDGRVL
jgi:hypothetical protein